jgi:3-methyl-2-oxobutanoate hydroxymethyltransferase
MKENREKIVMITAYDFFSGKIAELCDVDIILVGDSLGYVIKGENSTINVTMDEMIYHTKITRNGAAKSFIIADMPYMSYHLCHKEKKKNAVRLITEGKANAIKLEGGTQNRIDAIKAILDCEIPVCAHLGLTPQSINVLGKNQVVAKENEEQETLLQQANDIQNAGAFMLVLECVPEELGKRIQNELKIPVIGIGAGRFVDGQVLVWHDIFGMSDISAQFVKEYINLEKLMKQGVNNYKNEVKNKSFPDKKNVYYPID